MYTKKAVQQINDAHKHYKEGLIKEAEFVVIVIDIGEQMKKRILNDATENLNMLGVKLQ